MSQELKLGTLMGFDSRKKLDEAIMSSLGSWGRILPHIDDLPCAEELQLVLTISDSLEELPPPIKACFAEALVHSKNKVLLSGDLLVAKEIIGGRHGEERKE